MTDKFTGARLCVEIQMQEGETGENKDPLIMKLSTKQRTFTSSQHVPSIVPLEAHVYSLFAFLAKSRRVQRTVFLYSARAVLCKTFSLSCYFDTPGHSVCITTGSCYDFELFV